VTRSALLFLHNLSLFPSFLSLLSSGGASFAQSLPAIFTPRVFLSPLRARAYSSFFYRSSYTFERSSHGDCFSSFRSYPFCRSYLNQRFRVLEFSLLRCFYYRVSDLVLFGYSTRSLLIDLFLQALFFRLILVIIIFHSFFPHCYLFSEFAIFLDFEYTSCSQFAKADTKDMSFPI
jgi:hypothetical protein